MRPMPAYWLIKSEPSTYSYAQLEEDGETDWTGVRSFEARNNLRAMKPGDLALFYHSSEDKAVVAVAKIASGPTEDPTAKGEDWASVRVKPHKPLKRPVTLAEVKKDRALAKFPLVTRSRLSVAPVTAADFKRVLSLSGT